MTDAEPPPRDALHDRPIGRCPGSLSDCLPGPACLIARHAGLPTAFVRKQAKQYGTARLSEGAEVAGRRVLVVEDVVTSGGQVVISTAELRKLGAHVDHALCVIDRQEGGSEALAEAGITLRALLTRADLDAAAS